MSPLDAVYRRAGLLEARRVIAAKLAARVSLQAVGLAGAVGVFVLGALFAFEVAAGRSQLSPLLYPGRVGVTPGALAWLAGPLHGILPAPGSQFAALVLDAGMPLMFCFYVLALLGAAKLNRWLVMALAAAAGLLVVIAPPFSGTDQFNYLMFSAMGATYHLNPYLSLAQSAPHAGLIFAFSNWHSLRSPYGPLFTLLLYPVAGLDPHVAYWFARIGTWLCFLAVVWLCQAAARRLGRSESLAAAFVGLNPLVLVWGLGGGHNDFFAVAPVMAAVLLLARRTPIITATWTTRLQALGAGVALAAGAGVKASLAVCAPVLILGARGRRSWALAGALAGGVAVLAVVVLCFGGYLPNDTTQAALTSSNSVGNVLGNLLGLGGETELIHSLMGGLLMVAVLVLSMFAALRPRLAVECAACATAALVVSLSWLVPWYVVWFIAPAGLARSRGLRVFMVALCGVVMVASLPDASWLQGSGGSALRVLHLHQFLPYLN